MNKYIISILFCLIAIACRSQAQNTLENKDIVAIFDSNNGALVKFKDKNTGWNIIPEERLGQSYEMFFNLKGAGNCTLNGKTQKAPEVKKEGNKLTFVWKTLKTDKLLQDLDITFAGTVELTEEGLVFGGTVENRSEYMLEQLSWPFIGEVSMPKNTEKFLFQNIYYTKFNTVELFPNVSNSYTGWSNLPETSFALFHNEKQGLYLSSKDKNFDELIRCMYEVVPKDSYGTYAGGALTKENHGERDNMKLQIRANRSLYMPGKTDYSLVLVVLKPYTGSWHTGADIYKEWKMTWNEHPQWADWVKDVNSWQQLQINSSEDILQFKYKHLVQYAKECKAYGIDAIQLTGWNWGGQDKYIPSQDVDPRLGTKEDLKNAITECSKMGVKILLFTKFTWIDMTSDLYENEYKNYVAIDLHGDSCLHPGYNYNTYTQLMGINTRRFAVLCLEGEKCREAICKEFQKCLDLGAPGMVYDENQHHAGHMLCFDESHGHRIPGFLYRGADLLGQDFLEMAKKSNPDFFMNGEGCNDLQSRYYGTYTRADMNHIAVLRYLDPELPIACAVLGHDDKNTINMCLRNRYAISYEPRYFKGHLSEFPRLMAYGQSVDNLRKHYKDFLWDAEFRDVLGARVEGRYIEYSVFVRKSDGKKAVVVLNRNENNPTIASVTIDNSTSKLVVVSPENPNPVDFNGTISLQPQSAIVVLEK